METHDRQRTRKAYRIVVDAELGERFAAAFERMDVRTADGRTFITGEIIDQSHLHGVLNRINALGLELVSVQRVYEGTSQGHTVTRPGTIWTVDERITVEGRHAKEIDQ